MKKYETITKDELLSKASDKSGMTKKDLDTALSAFISATTETLSEGKGIKLIGFASLEIADVAERVARNPKTGEALTIPAHKTVKAKLSNTLKDVVK